ncbi:hypothetical protein LINPERHAP1_LOCUS38785 [Linum perenne]
MQWFFPICEGGHYSLFVVNLRHKRFEYLDSIYPEDLYTKWSITFDRVVRYVTSYITSYLSPSMDFSSFEWSTFKGMRQPFASNACGIYVLNWMEFWEGTVEPYMLTD